MNIITVKTKKFLPPQDRLLPEIFKKIKQLPEKTILAITSKVVSIDQGRCVLKSAIKDKDELIKAEADMYLPRECVPGGYVMHTIKNNLLIPSAGIDSSNSKNYLILWPTDINRIINHYYLMIKKQYRLKQFGIIITDSHSIPLRRGVVGISLATKGFLPLRDYRGTEDIFGIKLVSSQTNIADGLAAAATVVMGEGNEQTPLAIISKISGISFKNKAASNKKHSSFSVSIEQDIYRPLLKALPWRNKKIKK